MKPAQPRRAVPRTYSKHGFTSLKRAVNGLGGRVIDMRTTLGKALAQWRGDLVADLGGRDTISTQQAAVIDLAVKTKLLLDSHTFVSLMLTNGAKLGYVSKQIGHKNVATTLRHYYRWVQDDEGDQRQADLLEPKLGTKSPGRRISAGAGGGT